MLSDVVRVLIPASASFIIGILATPILTHYLYKYRAWKKTAGKNALDGSKALEFNKLHEESEVKAPRMGGIVVWASVLVTIIGIAIVAALFPSLEILNFLSRSQTWIPLAALIIGAIAGFVDDLLIIRGNGAGMPLSWRLFIVILFSIRT